MPNAPWILAARPKTLPAAIVPVWVGNAVPLTANETFSWLLLGATLLSCVCIQVATNLFNDAIDAAKGADTGERLGPMRVTASGVLSRETVVAVAIGFCVLAAVVAIPMILARGWIIVAIGLVSLFFSYGYTGGPCPLAYRGLGEVFVILFFGLVAVVGANFVQSGSFPPDPLVWILAVQAGLFSTVLIAINNLRDVDEDGKTGKRTLAVRFGKTFARWEIAVLCVVPLALAAWAGCFWVLALTPLSAWIVAGVFRTEPGRIHNRLLALAGLQLLLFGVLATMDLGLGSSA